MKLITFQTGNSQSDNSRFRVGILNGEQIIDLTPSLDSNGLQGFEVNRWLGEFHEGNIDGKSSLGRLRISEVTIAAPVPRPGKIICVGLNYRDHAEESGMAIPTSPIVFSKFSSCVIGSGEQIVIPTGSSQVDYEAELALVVGRKARDVKQKDALDHVLGYTNFNDVSARDFQFTDGQWQRGKSCDTFAPMGPFIGTKEEIPDPHNLSIKFHRNGETLQDSNTSQLIFSIPELIEFLSAVITLEPGDVIATGTPPGVGFARTPPVFLGEGDVAEVEIEGLGVLKNTVTEPRHV